MKLISKKFILTAAVILAALFLARWLTHPMLVAPEAESRSTVVTADASQTKDSTGAEPLVAAQQAGTVQGHAEPAEMKDEDMDALLEAARAQDKRDPLHDAPRLFLYRLDADELVALYERSIENNDLVTAGMIVTIRILRMINSGQTPEEQLDAAKQLNKDVEANPGLLASKDLASLYLGAQHKREEAERAMKLVQTHNAAYFKARESCLRYEVEFNIASSSQGTAIAAPSQKAKDYYDACVLASLEQGESVQQLVITHSAWLRRSLGLDAAKRFFADQSQRHGIRLPDEPMKMLLGE